MVTAKTLVTLDVKPWDDETDLVALEQAVRAIEQPGLLWGLSKRVPIGYGVSKIQFTVVVEDEQVSFEDLEGRITSEVEEYVQSTDVVAMQKL